MQKNNLESVKVGDTLFIDRNYCNNMGDFEALTPAEVIRVTPAMIEVKATYGNNHYFTTKFYKKTGFQVGMADVTFPDHLVKN